MATANVIKAKSATLTISTVDVVNFSRAGDALRIVARGPNTDFIYFTHAGPGGTAPDPTVAGDDCYCIQGGTTMHLPIEGRIPVGQVKLISAQAALYTVMAL